MKKQPRQEVRHYTKVRLDVPETPSYIVTCSCGWFTSGYISEDAADNAGDLHILAAIMGEP